MKFSNLFILLSTVVVITLLLTACGGGTEQTTASVSATEVPEKTTTQIWYCGAMEFETPGTCYGDIASIPADDGKLILVHSQSEYANDAGQAPMTFDAQIIDPHGNRKTYAACLWDGREYENPTINVPVLGVDDTEYHEVNCYDSLGSDKKLYFSGVFIVPVESNLVATLTAMPGSATEATPLPVEVTSTPTK